MSKLYPYVYSCNNHFLLGEILGNICFKCRVHMTYILRRCDPRSNWKVWTHKYIQYCEQAYITRVAEKSLYFTLQFDKCYYVLNESVCIPFFPKHSLMCHHVLFDVLKLCGAILVHSCFTSLCNLSLLQ